MKLEPVIGLEIHVQLKTKTKMFCRCNNRGEFEAPNVTICPVCMGHPGTLPVLNKKAVEFGVLAGLAIGANITEHPKFDRKNYFYPDLPKGYQISQYDLPIVLGGNVRFSVKTDGNQRREGSVRIHRIHLEEDAAKLVHSEDGKASYVDYNRGGTPLIEIVTEPDIASPADAKAFLQELRLIMRYLGVSDADMEKGHLRCDANISLRVVPENPTDDSWKSVLNPKTEVKNVNSFRSVERALEYEIKRQTKLWIDDKPPMESTTRGWDDAKGITTEQRSKEEANDYRYFPEPDLPPLNLIELRETMRSRVPELPEARRKRLVEEYGLSDDDARSLTEDKDLGDYAEKVFSELSEWVSSEKAAGEKINFGKERNAKLVSGWLLSKLGGVMAEHKLTITTVKITPENFAELLVLIEGGKVTGQNALVILDKMAQTGADPSIIMEEENLGQLGDDTELRLAVGNAIVGNPKAIEDWKNGKASAVQFLVGQVMRLTRGKSDPNRSREIIEEELKKI